MNRHVKNWDSTTWSGSRYIDVLDPKREDIDLVEIATGLSRERRYKAACTRIPWNVAKHSLLVYTQAREDGELPLRDLRCLLMHDAPEYILGDMIAPLKRQDPFYRSVEARWWGVIADRFGLPEVMPEVVHRYDVIALASEKAALVSPAAGDWPALDGVEARRIPPFIRRMTEEESLYEFLRVANYLGIG